jgi:phosphatidylglycerophosphatase A
VPLSLTLNRIAAGSFGVALLTLATFTLLAIWVAEKGEQIFREQDSPKIVIDEIAGFLLANFLSPPAFKPVVAAFLLFRFFDIMKVPPASWAERLPGGAGVVLDDLVSAVYAFLILRLLFFLSLL